MQILGLHKNIYKTDAMGLSIEINDRQAEERRKILGDWELLKKKGLSDHEIHSITGISRSTTIEERNALKSMAFKVLRTSLNALSEPGKAMCLSRQ
jgi:hypothetical protein